MFDLIKKLQNYVPYDNIEKQNVIRAIKFLQNNKDAFWRTNLSGHMTGGGLVADLCGHVLLNHHKKSGMWIQFGGHADGDTDIKRVSMREVFEECGIKNFIYNTNNIFDVDVQYISDSVNKGEPAHYHYDINYLYIVNKADSHISNESIEIKWVTVDEAHKLVQKDDYGMHRMLDKYAKFIKEYKNK